MRFKGSHNFDRIFHSGMPMPKNGDWASYPPYTCNGSNELVSVFHLRCMVKICPDSLHDALPCPLPFGKKPSMQTLPTAVKGS